MKLNHKIMAVLLAVVLLLVFAGGCLAEDTDATGFTSTTFADVEPSSWYYTGVRDAYNSGLMEGVGNKQFNPDSNFTVAQAIAVAARMYALYNKDSISTSTGVWYQPYIEYAADHGLLNHDLENTEEPDTVNATRAQAAFLFYGVLSKAEATPQYINTSTIPDLDQVPVDYASAVSNMYKLGIFTGMADGSFAGNADVTRAQIAVIISRVLDPSYRIPYDSKYNNELAGQEGNLFMYDGVIVYDDDYTYIVVTNINDSDKCSVVKCNNVTKKSQIIYAGNGEICNLRLKDNNLYFIEHMSYEQLVDDSVLDYSYLVKFDLNGNKAYCLYRSEYGMDIYPFELYGDKIYMNTGYDTFDPRINNNPEYDFDNDKIVCLNQDGSITELFTYPKTYLYIRKLFLFNDKLYYIDNDNNICSYDLNTKEMTIFMYYDDVNRTCGNVNLAGGILYVHESCLTGYGTFDHKIYKINLVTDNDYENDKEMLFSIRDTSPYFSYSVINQNIYIGYEGSIEGPEGPNNIYKLLGDGVLTVIKDVGLEPLNFIVTGSGEFMYMDTWIYSYPFYYVPGYQYSNGIVDYLGVGDFDISHAVKSVATGE